MRFKIPRLRAQQVVAWDSLASSILNRRYEGLDEKSDPLVAIAAMVRLRLHQ
jgi:hypothetical protein